MSKPKENGSSNRITMQDIARHANVSVGTVSHVINGTVPVRSAAKLRVQEAIEKLGFHPNHLSRALRTRRSNLIGMVIPDITNPFFPSVVRGVEDVAYMSSYRILLCNADNNIEKETEYLNDLCSFMPAGIILIPTNAYELKWTSGFPLVCIDRQPVGWQGDSVTVDNFEGGFSAGKLLASLEHRTIGIIRGSSTVVSSNERVRGFVDALQHSNITVSPEYVQEGLFNHESGYTCAMRLLRLVPRPSAIFACSDLMALGALAAVKASKLQCPRDVSIIGYDGLSLIDYTEPPLTSISQPSYQLGYAAARLLLDRIEGDQSAPRNIVLHTELRLQDSVQKPSH